MSRKPRRKEGRESMRLWRPAKTKKTAPDAPVEQEPMRDQSDRTPPDAALFRRALAQSPAGVTVTVADNGDAAHGLTVSSFTSVSMEPPLCLVCLRSDTPLLPILRTSRRFAVHVLAEDQIALAKTFASGSGAERRAALIRQAGAPPRLSAFLTRYSFRLWEERPAGDHAVVIGVLDGLETCDGDPEVLGESAFERLKRPLIWWRSAPRIMVSDEN